VSSLFGWQLSALFGNSSYQQTFCNSLIDPSLAVGVGDSSENNVARRLFNIQALTPPLCLRTDCDDTTDGYNIFIHVVSYARNTFNIKFLNAFNNNHNTWLTFCNTLNSARLNGTLLADTTIGIVCGLAGYTSPPNPSIGNSTLPTDTAFIIHEPASSLLGWNLVPLFPSQANVTAFCNQFSVYQPKIAILNLNTTLVQNAICQYTTQSSPSAIYLQSQFDLYWTRIFAATMWAVSDSVQYRQFICKGYTKGKLENFVKNLDLWDLLIPLVMANCQAAGVNA
jgi:hypothetical protein